MCDQDRSCVYCGSEEELNADPNLEGIWVCQSCLDKRKAHQSAIDYGYDDEEPAIE